MTPTPTPSTASTLQLNAAQRAAVERWGQDVCVVAGPGSGKTRVLIERFRWLVEHKGISPRRILAVTFTEKAATEIKKRLIGSVALNDQLREEIERAWVSTIHGFCTRLLKENAIAARVDPDFRLLDEAQSQILQRECAEAVLDDLLAARPAIVRDLLRHLNTGSDDLAGGLLALYEEARSAGIPVSQLHMPILDEEDGWQAVVNEARIVLAEAPGNWTYKQREAHQRMQRWARDLMMLTPSAPWQRRILALDEMPKASSLKSGTRARAVGQQLADALIPQTKAAIVFAAHAHVYPTCLHALQRIHATYAQSKREQGLLDFEDLQEFAIRLLESDDDLRAQIRNSFDQVLMDELQDTNRLQWRLIDLVRKPDALFAVGDINQSIYYFRHADPSVFRDYRDGLAARGAVIDELRENYRSRATIIETVNSIAPFLVAGVEPHLLSIQSEYPPKYEPSIEYTHTFAALPDQDATRTEAYWIANRIRQLTATLDIGRPGKQRLARYSDIAVLARTVAALTGVQQALDDFGIPSMVSGGRSFYESREVRDLLAWLSALANPLDEISLLTLLRSPFCGASDESILLLRSTNPSLIAAITESPEPRIQWLGQTVEQQRRRMDTTSPDALLAQALDESSYMESLAPRAKANIAKFLAILRARFNERPCTIGELIATLLRFRVTKSEAEASAEEVTNSVRLMSVHAAKGLEFPIVFIAGLRNGAQNREPMFCFDPAGAIGASWRHPTTGPGISDPTHLSVCAQKKRQEAGEEDRLLYVAMTRAEEHLLFTAAPGGKGKWAAHVAEGLLISSGVPKEELAESTSRLVITHTARVPQIFAHETAPDGMQQSVSLVPPPRPMQHDSVVPVTSVAQHAFCPRQYYLARYIGITAPGSMEPKPPCEEQPDEPPRDTGEFTSSELGVIVHELLAGKPVPAAPPQAHTLADSFRLRPLGKRAARAPRSGREYDFLIELEGMVLRGQIDLWFEENGELILVDYKTDQVNEGSERRHSIRYQPQLRLYAMAMERLTGRMPDRALLWYLRTSQVVEVVLDPESLAQVKEQVKALREAQANVVFPLREAQHCLRCGFYQNFCPSTFKDPEPEPKSSA